MGAAKNLANKGIDAAAGAAKGFVAKKLGRRMGIWDCLKTTGCIAAAGGACAAVGVETAGAACAAAIAGVSAACNDAAKKCIGRRNSMFSAAMGAVKGAAKNAA